MFQEIIIAGNSTRDAQEVQTHSGMAMATFTVAVNQFSRGEKTTMWVKVTCFDKAAATALKVVKKGTGVIVNGKLAFDEHTGGLRVYQRRDGKWDAGFEIIADKITLLPIGERPAPEQPAEQKEQPSVVPTPIPVYTPDDDEYIPF